MRAVQQVRIASATATTGLPRTRFFLSQLPLTAATAAAAGAQKLRCVPLDLWFRHFPMLGEELQYVLVLLPLAWFVDNNALLRQFLLLTYVSCYANNAAKEVLQLPRPPIGLHVNVGRAGHDGLAAQYGFPSTHCALAVAFSWLCVAGPLSTCVAWSASVCAAPG